MLYHYTDYMSAAEILRDGAIRAMPLTLYSDLFGCGPTTETLPAVWLTTSELPDATVLAKLAANGWPDGSIRRIAVNAPDAIDIVKFGWRCQLEPQWFRCMLLTANMVGSNPDDWRIVTHDITDILRDM